MHFKCDLETGRKDELVKPWSGYSGVERRQIRAVRWFLRKNLWKTLEPFRGVIITEDNQEALLSEIKRGVASVLSEAIDSGFLLPEPHIDFDVDFEVV